MYEKFTDKIQALEAEIGQIDERLQANSQNMEQAERDVKQLESKLLKARKAYALDDSLDNRKAVADAQKNLTSVKDDFDNLTILAEALADKKAGLESELRRTTDALRRAETDCMVSKAQGLVIAYDAAIRQAYKMSQYLQTLSKELTERKHFNILKVACPAAADLRFLPAVTLCTTKISPVNPCPPDPSKPWDPNYIEVYKCEQYNPEQIIKELIA